MITARMKYALKALIHLARAEPDSLVSATQMAQRESIPPRFLEQILHQLHAVGVVTGRNGRGGGHRLAREPQDICLLDIWRAIEGPVAPLPCVSLNFYERCDDCHSEEQCAVRRTLLPVRDAMLGVLGNTTLAQAAAW